MGLQPQNFASNLALVFFLVWYSYVVGRPYHPSTPQFYARRQQNRFRPLWIPGLLGLMCGIPNGWAMNSWAGFLREVSRFIRALASFWPVFGWTFQIFQVGCFFWKDHLMVFIIFHGHPWPMETSKVPPSADALGSDEALGWSGDPRGVGQGMCPWTGYPKIALFSRGHDCKALDFGVGCFQINSNVPTLGIFKVLNITTGGLVKQVKHGTFSQPSNLWGRIWRERPIENWVGFGWFWHPRAQPNSWPLD